MAERPNPEWLRNGHDGVIAWNHALQAWRGETRESSLDLQGVNLSGLNLKEVRFHNCNLEQADLSGSDLSHAILSASNLEGATLNNSTLDHVTLSAVRLNGASLKKANLGRAKLDNSSDLTNANLEDAILEETVFNSVNLQRANLSRARCSRASFESVVMEGATLHDADCRKARFTGANCKGLRAMRCRFEGASFATVDLEYADLRGSTADPETHFTTPTVTGCHVDRYFLDSLPTDDTGLPRGHRMQMVITDDVAALRMSYSGFLAWVHFLALLAFVFPYLWFTGKQYAIARFAGTEIGSGVPLWKAIALYIWTGGVEWHEGLFNPWPFCLAVLSLLYNALRGLLLWKTKSLELQEAATELPAKFSLVGRWGILYKVAWVGFWINLLLILLHSSHFLRQVVPIPNG